MASYNHLDENITAWSAIDSRFALSDHTLALAVVDSCRNINCILLAHRHIAGAPALRTLLTNHLTGSITIRTGLHVSNRSEERLLCIDNLPLTTALATGFRTGSGLCAGSVAGVTILFDSQFNFLLRTKYGFLEGYMYAGADICSFCRAIAAGTAATSAKAVMGSKEKP